MTRPRLAYRECHFVNDPDKQTCGNCGSSSLTEDRTGYVAITHPKDSGVATEMSVTEPGDYTSKVR